MSVCMSAVVVLRFPFVCCLVAVITDGRAWARRNIVMHPHQSVCWPRLWESFQFVPPNRHYVSQVTSLPAKGHVLTACFILALTHRELTTVAAEFDVSMWDTVSHLEWWCVTVQLLCQLVDAVILSILMPCLQTFLVDLTVDPAVRWIFWLMILMLVWWLAAVSPTIALIMWSIRWPLIQLVDQPLNNVQGH